MTENPNTSSNAAAGKLAVLLVQHGVVTVAQVNAALALQDNDNANLAKGLVDLGFLTESALTNFFVKHLKLPRLNLGDYRISQDVLKAVAPELCLRFRLIPIDILGKNLTLAMVNPLDDVALAAVQEACPGYRLKTFLCSLSDFDLVAGRLLRTDASDTSSSEMSLASLGMAPEKKKTQVAVAPAAPAAPSPPEADDDPTATKLFDGPAPMARKAAGPLRSSLICLDGWELGREIEIQGKGHTLGRSAEADTTIASPMISREHARITRNEEYGQETFVITDLKSSNGTFVNNIPVTTTLLRHGDRILLGNVLFKFVLLDEVEARFHKDVHRLYSIHKDTGLLPAEGWMQELERSVSDSTAAPLSVCLVEIDNLSAIVQGQGHIASVIVFSDLGDMLDRYLKRGDLPGDLGNGRIGLLFEQKPIEETFATLEDLRKMTENHVFHHKDTSFRTTISVGLVTGQPGDRTKTLLARLEEALAESIRQGRNCCSVQH